MAGRITEREETGVRLITLEMSEDELEVIAACLLYVLEHCSDEVLERVCGAYRDEVEAIKDDLVETLDALQLESVAVGALASRLP